MPGEGRPKVLVISLGGTITSLSNKDGVKYGAVPVDELVKSNPQLGEIAQIEFETVFTEGSPDITASIVLDVCSRFQDGFATGRCDAGVIIVGTDLTEEVMLLVDLTINLPNPVGVTGAIRRSTDLSPDVQINLNNVFSVVVSPEAWNRGAMYVSQHKIFEARSINKVSTTSVNAFDGIALGDIRGNEPYFYFHPGRPANWPSFDASNIHDLPKVPIIYGHLDQDEGILDYSMKRGNRGLILAAMGAGSWTTKGGEILKGLKDRGKEPIVVVSSRTITGLVTDEKYGLPSWTISAGTLSPPQACVLLRLCLAADFDTIKIRRIFDEQRMPGRYSLKSKL